MGRDEMSTSFVSTKNFRGYPCTHRQWKAKSHCRFIHGYSREFSFEFACSHLSREMWVVDFGGLGQVKKWLDRMFDHTFLVAQDDPERELFEEMDRRGIIQLRLMENTSMEGTAKFVYREVDRMIRKLTEGRAWVAKVEVRENEKNSAIFRPS